MRGTFRQTLSPRAEPIRTVAYFSEPANPHNSVSHRIFSILLFSSFKGAKNGIWVYLLTPNQYLTAINYRQGKISLQQGPTITRRSEERFENFEEDGVGECHAMLLGGEASVQCMIQLLFVPIRPGAGARVQIPRIDCGSDLVHRP